MTAPGIPNEYTLSTTCFGARLGSIQDQIFAAVGMGFRRIELGLTEMPPTMDGLEESRRETGVSIGSLVAGCRDSMNGGVLPSARLGSPDADERERAMNSVRRHVRLAQSWGCDTVVIRGNRVADEQLRQRTKDYDAQIEKDGMSPELREELLGFAHEVQKGGQKQVENLCRSLFTLHQEHPGVRFAVEPGIQLDDVLGFEAMGWVLDDLGSQGVTYWHDVGRIHMRERLGLPGQGEWLDSYGARMAGVHLQDAGDEEAEMPIGLGEVDFKLLREYVPGNAERVLEIGPRHGRAEILASVRFLVDAGF
ncbi:MAG: TIM barrel protein [Planctomycetota bacterium]